MVLGNQAIKVLGSIVIQMLRVAEEETFIVILSDRLAKPQGNISERISKTSSVSFNDALLWVSIPDFTHDPFWGL